MNLKGRESILSWINKLYETYDYCEGLVGVFGSDEKTPLLPISHSTQNAQIEIVINEEGDFLRARVLEKEESTTIIPVTEDSAARGNGNFPHSLCDKLQYVAGDFEQYVEKKKAREFFEKYMEGLDAWNNSMYSTPKVNAIHSYLKKEQLITDLVAQLILILDDDCKLKMDIKLGVGKQSDAFVRFRVESEQWKGGDVWLDPEMYDSYVRYCLSSEKKKDLCYVSGQVTRCSEKHPAKVRNTADKAKLISANDESGFTFRGRLDEKSQVVSVGYEASQKAHNALRWLVDQQGYRNGDQAIVAWGTKNQNLPGIFEDSHDCLFGFDESVVNTEKEFAQRLKHAIAGYGCDLDSRSEIVVMGLEAATPGRLSITFYREFNGSDFLAKIENWHRTCAWHHTYKRISDGVDSKGKKRIKRLDFVGTPSPKDIFLTAYGEKASDKLKKATIERLLPCIVDGARLPYDFVSSAINRITRPYTMEPWEWEKSLTITCALIKKNRYDKFREEWKMALDENQKDRSYIFGRLLAIAEQIENYALYTNGEKRATNAERLMHQFKIHPYKTWGILNDKLRPYISRLGTKGNHLVELMTKVNTMLDFEDFTSRKQLDDSFLLGYYCQRQIFVDEKDMRIAEKNQKKLQIVEGK
jgi:CRISPR-associated protein Csd1